MSEARPVETLPGERRQSIKILMIAMILALAAKPWIVRASNSIIATISAVGFAADDSFGAASFPQADAASTGYVSIPSARALLNAPRWQAEDLQTPAPEQADRTMALAVVGMPIDTGNALISDRTIEQGCLSESGSIEPCNSQDKLYDRLKYGKHLNLCDFDQECWHSTAAALVATGNGDTNPFVTPGQYSTTKFKMTTFKAIAQKDWKEFKESSSEPPTFDKFLAARFPGFGPYLEQKVEVATVGTPGIAVNSAYVTRPMLVHRGLSPGAPLIAINIFRGFGGNACLQQQRENTCLLTSTTAQEAALHYLLDRIDHGSPSSLMPAAVVLIAGGELVSAPCADAPIARVIHDLRQRGVVTFVAAGNDSKAEQVRFPACAPDAIAVGSLLRNGAVAGFGNGAKTGLISLYADGEVVALPLRGPRINPEPFGGIDPESCRDGNEYIDRECALRDASNQYDAFLAGGTLLSTAAVSGEFLNLRRHYKDLPSEAIVSALKAATVVTGAAAPEADVAVAMRWLDGYRQHHPVTTPQPIVPAVKSVSEGGRSFIAIGLIGVLALAWLLRRRLT